MGSADTKDATPMNLMNPDVKQELIWTKRMNEIETEAEARKQSLSVGSGVVHANGDWEFPTGAMEP